eukprot:gene10613-11738_t
MSQASPCLGGEIFRVEVDASNLAVCGVLLQEQLDGAIDPVIYFSTTLSKSEQNWSAHSKEAYALLVAVRTWHVYLAGTSFILHSDHNPLVHLRNRKHCGELVRNSHNLMNPSQF